MIIQFCVRLYSTKPSIRLDRTMTKLRRVLIQNAMGRTRKFADNPMDTLDNGLQEDHQHVLCKVLDEACISLKNNCIIAVPTDTVYGITGLAQSSPAVSQIYKIKGRDGGKPVSICVSDVKEIYRWGKVTVTDIILHDLLPGPVTVVLERTEQLNKDLNPGTNLVGIRVPDHDFIRQLAEKCDGPLALTSANISKQQSTLSTEEFQHLWSELDLVVDGGTLGDTEESRCGSTVVDLSLSGRYKVIRPGSALVNTREILEKHGLKETQLGTDT